tara:strand:+ start:474 stop:653 length:180 start_codon:yes stop_codon:yes gene_type:complete
MRILNDTKGNANGQVILEAEEVEAIVISLEPFDGDPDFDKALREQFQALLNLMVKNDEL